MPKTVAFAVMLVYPGFAVSADLVISSHTFDKDYTVTVSTKALLASPAWDGASENPPLSARKAMALADAKKDKLVRDSEDWKWRFGSASLYRADEGRWLWLVSYEAEFKGFLDGVPPFLRLVVLMNGTVPEPKVGDEPRR